MKFYQFVLMVSVIVLLNAGPVRAGTVDFFDHKNGDDKNSTKEHHNYSSKDDDKEFDWSDNKDKSDWSHDENKENKISHSDNNADHNYWHDGNSDFDGDKFNKQFDRISHPHDDDDDYDDHKHKKDHYSPPICAAADLNHHGKNHDGDGDGDHRFGRHFSDYYKKICDHDWHHWHRGCDPGDPGDSLPLPGSVWLFMTGMILLAGLTRYKKLRSSERYAK